jgi:glycosyltransferase involved in cell wall biosynthesis
MMSDRASRIVHVPRRFVRHEWGGTETVLAGLVAEQLLAGWEPEIHTSLALSDQRRESWNGVPIFRYPYCYPFFGLDQEQRLRLDKKGGNLLSFSLLLALLRRPAVRLFHAHTLKRVGGTVFTAARLRGKPFVVTLHGGVFDVPAQESSDLLEAQSGAFEWGKPFGLLLRSRRLLHEADAVICLGRAEYEGARRALGHERIYQLGNGVRAGKFAQGNGQSFRVRHGIPPGSLVAACYSRFDPQKDQLNLLEAFDRVAGEFPTFHLVLAGPCTVPEYLEAIDRRIAASPFAARVRRLDAINNAGCDLADAYQGCDIFALPSRHEPFGIVVLEAWSAGKAVIASAVGGLRDLIADGETGLLLPPGEPEALAGALRTLLSSDELRTRLGQAGRELARGQYSWERVAAETERIYEAAAAHARVGGTPSLAPTPC